MGGKQKDSMAPIVYGNGSHLFVVSSGFFGRPSDVDRLAQTICARFRSSQDNNKDVDEARVLVSSSNIGFKTYDGLRECGHRLFEEIVREATSKQTTAISLIGYSAGGLFMRIAAGHLLKENFLEKYTIDAVNFVTIATPHLGVVTPKATSCAESFRFKLLLLCAKSIGGKTLEQLALQDDEQVIQEMSIEGSCEMRALAQFSSKTFYANVSHDASVEYTSAAIAQGNPYTCGATIIKQPMGLISTPSTSISSSPATSMSTTGSMFSNPTESDQKGQTQPLLSHQTTGTADILRVQDIKQNAMHHLDRRAPPKGCVKQNCHDCCAPVPICAQLPVMCCVRVCGCCSAGIPSIPRCCVSTIHGLSHVAKTQANIIAAFQTQENCQRVDIGLPMFNTHAGIIFRKFYNKRGLPVVEYVANQLISSQKSKTPNNATPNREEAQQHRDREDEQRYLNLKQNALEHLNKISQV